jgi:hypothetical protein
MKSSRGTGNGKKSLSNEMERDAVFVRLTDMFRARTSSAALIGILVGTFLMGFVFVGAIICFGFRLIPLSLLGI